MTIDFRVISRCVLPLAAVIGLHAAAPENVLIYHEVKTYAAGNIVPWYGDGPSQAYDHVVRLVWDFWREMKPCANRVSYYLQHQVWKPEEDRRGLGGDQIAMAMSSWSLLYNYTGDSRLIDNMRHMADYWLAHGMSKRDDKWPNLPFPYNTELHSGVYDGDMVAGKNYLQPDKAGSFAKELITLYKITSDEKYVRAAVTIANALAAKVQPGNAENSPWPYRVNANTGAVHTVTDKSKTFRANYTTNYTGTLEMFAALEALGRGNAQAYRKASSILGAWLKAYPLKTNKWGPFFEDVPTQSYSDTEINADTMAMYLLEHREFAGGDAARLAAGILAWTEQTLNNHEFEKWGVTAINEQSAYRVPGNSHTSRHASVELRYCEYTGDNRRKDQAVRRPTGPLTWWTTMARTAIGATITG